MAGERRRLQDGDYRRLLAFRTSLRRFQRWSADQAATVGLTSAQHQLLLAVRGHDDVRGPTIGQLADYLFVRHHSAVELVDRCVSAGLLLRRRDEEDQRVVRLALTDEGRERLDALSVSHLEELRRLTPSLAGLLHDLVDQPAAAPRP